MNFFIVIGDSAGGLEAFNDFPKIFYFIPYLFPQNTWPPGPHVNLNTYDTLRFVGGGGIARENQMFS